MEFQSRTHQWIETSSGYQLSPGTVAAHRDHVQMNIRPVLMQRERREEFESCCLAEGATLSEGAGNRKIPEAADPFRTAFESDRDRILHSTAFRRLAGKTQVFIFPSDHQRTRLTHALEVSQVATAVSRAVGLNIALTEAIAYGHDCGHGPGGHASEDAFSAFLSEGYDHATWGADYTLSELNLCLETLDGIRNHSWSRPQPMTPEGAVVSFADRIAYCAHDLEDAIRAGVVSDRQIPKSVTSSAGGTRARQLSYFISDMVKTISTTGEVALSSDAASVLSDLREFNYSYIYMRPDSLAQSETVIRVLGSLVEYYIENLQLLPPETSEATDFDIARIEKAIAYVSGMTDRFAFQKAKELTGLDPSSLPLGIDLTYI